MSCCNGISNGGTSLDGVVAETVEDNVEGGTVLHPWRLSVTAYL
jgi:hypothetical protein